MARLGSTGDHVLIGIGLVIASTLSFAISDVAAKLLTTTVPPLEVVWLRYLVFCLLILPAAAFRSRRGCSGYLRRPGAQLLRGLSLVGSSILFTWGLKFLPIADATAISFIAPIFVLALSVPVLGEQVGARRWTAALVGLIGVLIVVRPGSGSFQPAALLPLTSALLWAYTIVATRDMHETEPPLITLAWSALIGFTAMSAIVPFQWVGLGLRDIGLGVLTGTLSAAGQWLMIQAYAKARASVLAPLSYAQLIWATALGFIVFGALPGIWTYAGAAVITVSGLYIAHREGRRGSVERPQPD